MRVQITAKLPPLHVVVIVRPKALHDVDAVPHGGAHGFHELPGHADDVQALHGAALHADDAAATDSDAGVPHAIDDGFVGVSCKRYAIAEVDAVRGPTKLIASPCAHQYDLPYRHE